MDSTYTNHLFLSLLFFAPGALLLAGLALVGLLMVLEKTVFGARDGAGVLPSVGLSPSAVAVPPSSGHIVDALRTRIAPPADQGAHQPQRKVANQSRL